MYKNFNDYYKAYLDQYSKTPINEKDNKKKYTFKLDQYFLLGIPFIFIFILSSIIDIDRINYNSSQINQLYSEKYISDDFNTRLNKINDPNKFFAAINFDRRAVSLHDKKNIINFSDSAFIISESRIKNIGINLDSKELTPVNWKKNFSKKKIKFIETLLPLIANQNQQILIERKKLTIIHELLQNEKTLPKEELLYLKNLASKYALNIENKHKIDVINKLFESVNIIPVSIVLAQAANESAWGTSRFAKEYNALFGQYTYDEENGVIPFERESGKKHLIKNFSSIDKSVESYFMNINTHYAYKKFRTIRNTMDEDNIVIKSLTQSLDVYAEDEMYVNTLNAIIDSNNLTQFDSEIYSFTNS